MNQDTETNINEAIDWLQASASQIQNFAAEQAPLYCREIVGWTFWEAIVWIGAGVMIGIVSAALLKWGASLFKEDPWCEKSCFPIIGGFVTGITAVMMITSNLPSAIKATVAPRLVIIEHLQGLTK